MKKWFILKPLRRTKEEMQHPAKFPESLVSFFINNFTCENDNILDPMAGTGTVLLEALLNKRNGYGVELSSLFADIAINRCSKVANTQTYKIENTDARNISSLSFPPMDYVLTSPPYWDMLNRKGAGNQKSRREKGLKTTYSESLYDLGNISDYDLFLNELYAIYRDVIGILKPGKYFTVIVKNIKKQGKNYPLAWDLAEKLQQEVILQPTFFWCQDDISIAPYGFGNTWVSNTFHHYCLNFKKPK